MDTTIAYQDEHVGITQTVVGALANNVYIVTSQGTGQSVLIDAAASGETLVPWAQKLGVHSVLTTHGHHDHIGAVAAFRAAEVPVWVSAEDADQLPAHDFAIDNGEEFPLGDVFVQAIKTPGHTSGSVCFAVPGSPILFTGDTLFPGGPGATRSPSSSFPQIIESIRTRIFDAFPDDTQIFPGHGLPTTIGAERPHLDEWIARGW